MVLSLLKTIKILPKAAKTIEITIKFVVLVANIKSDERLHNHTGRIICLSQKWTNGYIYSSVPQISILFLHYKHSAFLCISLHFITFYVLGKFDRAYLHYMDIIFCFGFDLFRTYLTLFLRKSLDSSLTYIYSAQI